ncbi:thioredoxin family protein [Paenibacillus sp. MER TA 81-3]|uniref:thioredoxin family protein n=1 Tax=Paenibacillus sp. MER TA 81-3 TaxID=2939573 RepID=UPI00203BA040|nr:thioredoxin family protein [Paenibacillus sp. MER TA 81-3]MCM3342838.1 thioredoxin family protein [Paenibacillus sp. MER TA 81-3]
MEKITTEKQYHNQIGKDEFTILKFYTNWCPDCKNLDRFIGDIVIENSDKEWLEVDAEQLQHIAEENDVRGIPSLLAFKNGQKVGHLHSKFAKTPDQIREFLSTLS